MFTPFEELDALLADFTRSVRDILGDTFVGAYVQGSFALRAGDMHSDCDFVVATTVLPSGSAEAELRRLHDEIPTRRGFRTRGWDPADPPRPGSLEATYAFAAYAQSFAD
ncbi:hypothetical protein ABT186_47030 [Streptomyces sp. NPDC001634]|uniref:hypothetical protein n=1 Tax=Streptomyces sp. NPDC001634 TaxID=3154390 RepID=UPI003331EC64